MNDVENNEEKKKTSKAKKIIVGATCLVVVVGATCATTIAILKNADKETGTNNTNSQISEENKIVSDEKNKPNENNNILNIQLTDEDLYAVGYGDIAFIENGEVYYGYSKKISEGTLDCEIPVKKINGIKNAVSIGSYNLATDVTKTFYVVTEEGDLYSLTYEEGMENCKAKRVFDKYKIKSVVSAQGEENKEYIFILKDNRKIKISTKLDDNSENVEELEKYSDVVVSGNIGNKQNGTQLYDGGFEAMSFIINGNVYISSVEPMDGTGDLPIRAKKVNSISGVRNISALAIGNDPSLTFFAIKENGEVYNYLYRDNTAKKCEFMKDYKVDTIIGQYPVKSSDGMDAYEIKLKLKDGSNASAYTPNAVTNGGESNETTPVSENNNSNEAIKEELKSRRFIAKNNIYVNSPAKFMKIGNSDIYLVHVAYDSDENNNKSTYFIVKYKDGSVVFNKELEHKYEYMVSVDTTNKILKAELSYKGCLRYIYYNIANGEFSLIEDLQEPFSDEYTNTVPYMISEREVQKNELEQAKSKYNKYTFVSFDETAVELNDANIDKLVK